MPSRTARATLAVVGLTAALGLPCGAAQAVSSDPTAFANGLATSATHVVSVGVSNPCPNASGDGVVEKLSDDRGQTWVDGSCVPSPTSAKVVDPTSGLLVYSTPTDIVWLAPSGAIATEVAAPAGSAVVAADDGYAFVLSAPGLARVARDGSVTACAPEIQGTSTSRILVALAAGVLVGTPSGPYAGTLSRDDCASFLPDPNLAGCSDTGFRALGPNAVYCDSLTTGGYFDPRYSHLVRIPSVNRSPLWTWDGSTLETVDALATAAAPSTWPAAEPSRPQRIAGDARPGGAVGAALADLDTRWRTPLGLPPLAWSALAATVAFDHAHEWDLAGALPPPDAGSETPGAPGFTGSDGSTRCVQAGLLSCVEADRPGASDPASALASMLGDPGIAFELMSLPRIGVAMSASGTVAVLAPESRADTDLTAAPAGSTFDFDLPANQPSSTIRVWPPDGASDVPGSWTNPGTIPANAFAAIGDPATVGYPIDIVAHESGTWQLLDAGGMPVQLFEYGIQRASLTASFEFATAYPISPLTPGARYTIDLRPDIGPHESLQFTVAGGKRAAVVTATRCSVSVRQRRAGSMTRVTITRARSGCSGTRLQWRRRAPGAWRALASRGIVAPARRVLYWRVVSGARLLAHGRVVVRARR